MNIFNVLFHSIHLLAPAQEFSKNNRQISPYVFVCELLDHTTDRDRVEQQQVQKTNPKKMPICFFLVLNIDLQFTSYKSFSKKNCWCCRIFSFGKPCSKRSCTGRVSVHMLTEILYICTMVRTDCTLVGAILCICCVVYYIVHFLWLGP